MTIKLGNTKGLAKLPERYARNIDMVSRVGSYSSFSSSSGVSYNLARASNGGSNATWDNNHILIHSIQAINTSNDSAATIKFYQNNDETNAEADNSTNRLFYFVLAGSNQDRASHTLQVDFPIPLCVKGGCHVTSNIGGPIINVCYTVLNTQSDDEYENVLKYKYLSGASIHSSTQDLIHPISSDITSDVEVWGGVVYNHSTTSNNYNSAFIYSDTGNVKQATLSTNEQKHASGDASAAFTSPGQTVQFWPYPVICKGGARMATDDSSTYATWFYRERNAATTYTEGWMG